MALVKRVLNPSKKTDIHGLIFYIVILQGGKAALYDAEFDAPIIYSDKAGIRAHFNSPKLFPALYSKSTPNKPIAEQTITVYVYKMETDGELKKWGEPLRGKPSEITLPN